MEAVYIHIPFCKQICSYCDFCKVLHIDSFVNNYLEALQREIESSYKGERIKTLYRVFLFIPSIVPNILIITIIKK